MDDSDTLDTYNLDNESRKLGFVCGLKSEADCLEGVVPGDMIAISGASPARARRGAERLLTEGALGLVSFGLCGALDTALRPGDLIVSQTVLQTGMSAIDAHAPWLGFLVSLGEEHGLPIHRATLFGSDEIVSTPAHKAGLARRWSAQAVDMESHAVMAAAELANVPFVAIRAVADPANRAIPKSALTAIAEDGSLRKSKVLSKLIVRPQDVFTLIRLGRDNQAALQSLRGCARNLLPFFLRSV